MEHENDNYLFVDKKQFCLSMIIITVLILTLFVSLYLIFNSQINEINSTITQLDNKTVFQETSYTSTEEIYLIKEVDGKIGVYIDGKLDEILDIYVFALPENDKQLLQEGIRASSEQELREIISCYY